MSETKGTQEAHSHDPGNPVVNETGEVCNCSKSNPDYRGDSHSKEAAQIQEENQEFKRTAEQAAKQSTAADVDSPTPDRWMDVSEHVEASDDASTDEPTEDLTGHVQSGAEKNAEESNEAEEELQHQEDSNRAKPKLKRK